MAVWMGKRPRRNVADWKRNGRCMENQGGGERGSEDIASMNKKKTGALGRGSRSRRTGSISKKARKRRACQDPQEGGVEKRKKQKRRSSGKRDRGEMKNTRRRTSGGGRTKKIELFLDFD